MALVSGAARTFCAIFAAGRGDEDEEEHACGAGWMGCRWCRSLYGVAVLIATRRHALWHTVGTSTSVCEQQRLGGFECFALFNFLRKIFVEGMINDPACTNAFCWLVFWDGIEGILLILGKSMFDSHVRRFATEPVCVWDVLLKRVYVCLLAHRDNNRRLGAIVRY